MSEKTAWPEWLESFRVQDEDIALAYDSFPASYRGALKTGLALAQFHFGMSEGNKESILRGSHSGFWRKRRNFPRLWALIAIGRDYRAAARVCAAAVLPILADVELVGAICFGEASPQTLCALELSGVEDVFCIEESKLYPLARDMRGRGKGSVAALANMDIVSCLAANIDANLFNLFEEGSPPELFVADESIDMKLLDFCQGDFIALESYESGNPDAVYASEDYLDKIIAGHYAGEPCSIPRLLLAPGCEGFWLHPGIGPDFFRYTPSAFGLL